MARLLLLYILNNGRLDQLILKMEVVKQKIEKKLVNYLKYRPKSPERKLGNLNLPYNSDFSTMQTLNDVSSFNFGIN